MALKKVRSKIGREQAARVMREFYKGDLRMRSGRKLDPDSSLDREIAKAIAMSEARAAEKRGLTRRTFMGETRLRPKLKKR